MQLSIRKQLYTARKIFYTATLSAFIYICPNIIYAGTPTLSSCGTASTTLVSGSTDVTGTIYSKDTVLTTCTLNFSSTKPWTNKTPNCVVSQRTKTPSGHLANVTASATPTTLLINSNDTSYFINPTAITYICLVDPMNIIATTTIATGSFDGIYYFNGIILFLLVGGFFATYFKRKR